MQQGMEFGSKRLTIMDMLSFFKVMAAPRPPAESPRHGILLHYSSTAATSLVTGSWGRLLVLLLIFPLFNLSCLCTGRYNLLHCPTSGHVCMYVCICIFSLVSLKSAFTQGGTATCPGWFSLLAQCWAVGLEVVGGTADLSYFYSTAEHSSTMHAVCII